MPEVTPLGGGRAGVRFEPRNLLAKVSAPAKERDGDVELGAQVETGSSRKEKRDTEKAGGRVPETHPRDLDFARGLSHYIIEQ